MLRSDGRWGRLPLALAALAVLAGGGVAIYLAFGQAPEDVSNPDVEFKREPPPKPPPKRRRGETFVWPTYGYTPARTRYFNADIRPPYRRLWDVRGGGVLLEFQPILVKGTLYMIRNDGLALAIRARDGRVLWRKRVGNLNATSPAWMDGRLFIVSLSRLAFCLDARTGRTIWKKQLSSRSESSPLAQRGRVYFGTEDGTVYALRARDGGEVWKYRAGGAVKGSVAYRDGRLFFGDYSGDVTAIRTTNGSKVWSAGTAGRSFGRSGRFYSTPAVAFGRVYLGNTDGKVYSFSARNGRLAWTKSTGAYVYAAAAVGDVPRLGPTVFIGSYSGTFYALNARSGAVRWSHDGGGKISGAPTVIGRIVYFANLGDTSTIGLDVRSGRRVWHLDSGAFNPAISDGKRLYITGYSTQYAFVPKRRRSAPPRRTSRPPRRSRRR